MEHIKKLIVCLDQSPMTENLVKFASYIAFTHQTKKIYFINVVRNLNVPKEILEEFPNLLESLVTERKSQMEKAVKKHYVPQPNVSISFLVKEGQLAKKVLKLAHEKSADMIMIGRKVTLPGTGVASQRLARRASCSLMIVPEGAKPTFKKILVPSDFSEYSTEAMKAAITLLKASGKKGEIICQNVYTVPSGYHFTGKTFEEFAEIMQKHAETNFKRFIKKIDTKGVTISAIYTKDEDDDPVEDILENARENKVDAIVIGVKGRTAATALFIGSLAERLIQLNNSFPTLVSRPKGNNAGILEYLLEV